MKRIPPIEHAFQPSTETCNLLQLPSRPECNGIPANGNRFQEWEKQMIEAMKPGGEKATIIEHGDNEYLVPYRLFDPFTTIGSRFYALLPLPELQPSGAREYGLSDHEQEDNESCESGEDDFKECEAQEAPPRHKWLQTRNLPVLPERQLFETNTLRRERSLGTILQSRPT